MTHLGRRRVLTGLLLGACLGHGQAQPRAGSAQQTYNFQHQLIPQLIFGTEGHFFQDLLEGRLARFQAYAKEVGFAQEAADLVVEPLEGVDGTEGVLLRFPAPKAPPDCHFMAILKRPDAPGGFLLYTLEATLILSADQKEKAVLGGWTAEHHHLNFGGRESIERASFVGEVRALAARANRAPHAAQAAQTPASAAVGSGTSK